MKADQKYIYNSIVESSKMKSDRPFTADLILYYSNQSLTLNIHDDISKSDLNSANGIFTDFIFLPRLNAVILLHNFDEYPGLNRR